MTQTIEFTPCTHKLSLVKGIYVIMQGDVLAATCNRITLVEEFLRDVTYKDAHEVRIYLSSVIDFDTDEITHLIAADMFSDDHGHAYATYEDWSELTGMELPWLEFWFDEWNPTTHGADRHSRVRRYNEINAGSARVEFGMEKVA